MKIYTVAVQSITDGTASIEAENEKEAIEKLQRLQEHGALVINIEVGSGFQRLHNPLYEETDPMDGFHMMDTPSHNAQENAEALEGLDEDND